MPYFKQIALFSLFLLFVFVPYVVFAGKPLENKTIPLEKEATAEKQANVQEIITEVTSKIENGELDLQNYKDVQRTVMISYEHLGPSKISIAKKANAVMASVTLLFIAISATLTAVKLILG